MNFSESRENDVLHQYGMLSEISRDFTFSSRSGFKRENTFDMFVLLSLFFLSFFVFDVSRFTRTMTQIESTIGLFGLAFCLLFLAVSVLSSFRDKDMNRGTICCRCFDDLQRFIVCSSR